MAPRKQTLSISFTCVLPLEQGVWLHGQMKRRSCSPLDVIRALIDEAMKRDERQALEDAQPAAIPKAAKWRADQG